MTSSTLPALPERPTIRPLFRGQILDAMARAEGHSSRHSVITCDYPVDIPGLPASVCHGILEARPVTFHLAPDRQALCEYIAAVIDQMLKDPATCATPTP